MKYCFYSFAAKFKSTLKQAKWKQSFLKKVKLQVKGLQVCY